MDNLHVNYPHEPGYLIDCPACENGPCECSGPCPSHPDCWCDGNNSAHRAPCVSTSCEQEQ